MIDGSECVLGNDESTTGDFEHEEPDEDNPEIGNL